jgi:class 3 adenylate cyclase
VSDACLLRLQLFFVGLLSSSLYLVLFKVETIGDCYVAVTGLPDPRKDHAVSCPLRSLYRMNFLVRKLGVALGPDTAVYRCDSVLHSGPVTAGVFARQFASR